MQSFFQKTVLSPFPCFPDLPTHASPNSLTSARAAEYILSGYTKWCYKNDP